MVYTSPDDDHNLGHIVAPGRIKNYDSYNETSITVQCFPFYSILLAVRQIRVDFFSLDVEGHELRILKTIPFHKVDIKVTENIKSFRFDIRLFSKT